jgi:hypothetical protein
VRPPCDEPFPAADARTGPLTAEEERLSALSDPLPGFRPSSQTPVSLFDALDMGVYDDTCICVPSSFCEQGHWGCGDHAEGPIHSSVSESSWPSYESMETSPCPHSTEERLSRPSTSALPNTTQTSSSGYSSLPDVDETNERATRHANAVLLADLLLGDHNNNYPPEPVVNLTSNRLTPDLSAYDAARLEPGQQVRVTAAPAFVYRMGPNGSDVELASQGYLYNFWQDGEGRPRMLPVEQRTELTPDQRRFIVNRWPRRGNGPMEEFLPLAQFMLAEFFHMSKKCIQRSIAGWIREGWLRRIPSGPEKDRIVPVTLSQPSLQTATPSQGSSGASGSSSRAMAGAAAFMALLLPQADAQTTVGDDTVARYFRCWYEFDFVPYADAFKAGVSFWHNAAGWVLLSMALLTIFLIIRFTRQLERRFATMDARAEEQMCLIRQLQDDYLDFRRPTAARDSQVAFEAKTKGFFRMAGENRSAKVSEVRAVERSWNPLREPQVHCVALCPEERSSLLTTLRARMTSISGRFVSMECGLTFR